MLVLGQKSEHSSALFCKSSCDISGSNMRFPTRRYKRRSIPRAKHLDPEYWETRVVNLHYPYYMRLLYGRNIVSLPYRSYRPLRKSLFSIIMSELVNFAAFTRLKSGHTNQKGRSWGHNPSAKFLNREFACPYRYISPRNGSP